MKIIDVAISCGVAALLLSGCGDTSKPVVASAPVETSAAPQDDQMSSLPKGGGLQASIDDSAWVDVIPTQTGALWAGKRDPEHKNLPTLLITALTDGNEITNDEFGEVQLQVVKLAQRSENEAIVAFQPCEVLLRQGDDDLDAACKQVGSFRFLTLSLSTGSINEIKVAPAFAKFLAGQDKIMFERIVNDTLYMTSSSDFALTEVRWPIGDESFTTMPLNAQDKFDGRSTCVADDGTRYDGIAAGSALSQSGEKQDEPPDYRVDIRSPEAVLEIVQPPAPEIPQGSWALSCVDESVYLVSGGLTPIQAVERATGEPVTDLVPSPPPASLTVLQLPSMKTVPVVGDSALVGNAGLLVTSADSSESLSKATRSKTLPWLPPGGIEFAGSTVLVRPDEASSSDAYIIDLDRYTSGDAESFRRALYG